MARVSACMRKYGTRAWEETLVFGIGQDGLWHFACDDSPFAYIMLVASVFFFPISFPYHQAVLGCPNLQRGIDGHTLVWGR